MCSSDLRVLSELLQGVEQLDDVALMVMRTQPLGPRLTLRLAADPQMLSALRRQLARWLRENDVDDRTAFDIVLASSEAGANAAEHAYSPRRGHFEVEALREGDHVVVTVRDDGTWRPEAERDRGRGLMLMRGLTDDVSIERREPAGTVVTMRRRVGGGER